MTTLDFQVTLNTAELGKSIGEVLDRMLAEKTWTLENALKARVSAAVNEAIARALAAPGFQVELDTAIRKGLLAGAEAAADKAMRAVKAPRAQLVLEDALRASAKDEVK